MAYRMQFDKGRRSGAHRGAFEMDLTARDPSKVPRCILRRFAGMSKACHPEVNAEGLQAEILSVVREG